MNEIQDYLCSRKKWDSLLWGVLFEGSDRIIINQNHMHHIAIMNPKWKLIDKILSWEKTIESRWYKTKRQPWNSIKAWDKIYFKDAGKKVTAEAQVSKVLQYESLDEKAFDGIIADYADKIALSSRKYDEYYSSKNYCILVFLENVQKIEAFDIDKKWFWIWCAWIAVDDIEAIKIR